MKYSKKPVVIEATYEKVNNGEKNDPTNQL